MKESDFMNSNVNTLETRIRDNADATERTLSHIMEGRDGDLQRIFDAQSYSLLGGGKRIRPFLVNEFCRALGGDPMVSMPYACALEMIHTYSLIHDDLPCMDNDDFRRGKPSCHKKFGEAMALLAGDALLNTAHELMAMESNTPGEIRAMRHIAKSAGVHGMINGQVRDIKLLEDDNPDENKLIALIEQKTMALIMTAVVSAAYIAEADEKTISDLEDFVYNLGIAFQIRDDFEDEDEDKQKEHNSPNFINILGRDAAADRMRYHELQAREIISKYKNNEFIIGIIDYLFS